MIFYLIVGPCISYPSLGSFCGVSTPTYVQSNGMYVLITFQTDSTTEYKGFNMSYYLRTGNLMLFIVCIFPNIYFCKNNFSFKLLFNVLFCITRWLLFKGKHRLSQTFPWGVRFLRKKSDSKTICFKKIQKILRPNSKRKW